MEEEDTLIADAIEVNIVMYMKGLQARVRHRVVAQVDM
mgnify:CR=1 FL=1